MAAMAESSRVFITNRLLTCPGCATSSLYLLVKSISKQRSLLSHEHMKRTTDVVSTWEIYYQQMQDMEHLWKLWIITKFKFSQYVPKPSPPKKNQTNLTFASKTLFQAAPRRGAHPSGQYFFSLPMDLVIRIYSKSCKFTFTCLATW